MVGINRSYRSGIFIGLGLLTTLPILLGQSCGGNNVTPIPVDTTQMFQNAKDLPTGSGTSEGLTFEFTAPMTDVSAEVGDLVTISWNVSDPDNNPAIELLLDPDANFGNGNERTVVPLILGNSGVHTYSLDTQALNLPPATYRIVARINDGVYPELLVVAPGQILLYGAGLLPGNRSPVISVVDPTSNLGVSHGDAVTITYCGRDRDNPGAGNANPVPDIVVLLDLDDDPTNDLDLSSADAASYLGQLCSGGLPKTIPGAIVISCAKKTADCVNAAVAPDPNNPATPQQIQLMIDVGVIPPPPSGEPYHIRADMWDHINPAVHSYAPGTLNITALGSGIIDLASVGRSVSGTKFVGFDSGARAGFTGCSVGDYDLDGADDFIVVNRYGRPNERGNVGSAFMIYGNPGKKLGGTIPLNSLGQGYRGCGFMAGLGACWGTIPATDGITAVARIDDLNFDGKPEIFFGLPYVETMYDWADDDPCDGAIKCYNDRFPNPLADGIPGNDDMGNYDWHEGDVDLGDGVFMLCSNDKDYVRTTPINQGYVLMVRSDNTMEGNMIDLPLLGQYDPGPTNMCNDERLGFPGSMAPTGARFRGGWYDLPDLDQTRYPYAIIPDNQFGSQIASMPDMGNGSVSPMRDGAPELLISGPGGYRGKGEVVMIYGQDYAEFRGSDGIPSIPAYRRVGNCGRNMEVPVDRFITGAAVGDHLGYGSSAGDYNLDGHQDILCGAPGASRDGLLSNGMVYVIFGRLDFANIDLEKMNPPRMEIHGAASNDRLGSMQTLVGDINQDGIADIGVASQYVTGPGGTEAGFIGVIFGGRQLTGENVFNMNQIATSQLPGVKFYGSQLRGHAGAEISNAGDFNGDGIDDMLISAPNETRIVGGQTRRGVAYIVFGGPHLKNGTFSLNQVGTVALPGVIIVTPYADGTADAAPIDWVSAAGDVNADGFADVLVGVSTADFVNPLEPSQRRVDSGEAYLIYGSNTGSNAMR